MCFPPSLFSPRLRSTYHEVIRVRARDRGADDHGVRAGRDRRRRQRRRVVAALGEQRRAKRRAARAPASRSGIAGHRRRRCSPTSCSQRYRRRPPPPRASLRYRRNRPSRGIRPRAWMAAISSATGTAARPRGSIEGDDRRARVGQCVHVLEQRRDAHGAIRQITLDQADDRQIARRADRGDVAGALDAQPARAAIARRQREADHERHAASIGPSRHRLAGNDQAAAQSLDQRGGSRGHRVGAIGSAIARRKSSSVIAGGRPSRTRARTSAMNAA